MVSPISIQHNAGNDASYTLRVMIAIAMDDFQNERTAKEWEIEKHSRIEAASEEARAKVCNEFRAGVHLRMRISQTLLPRP